MWSCSGASPPTVPLHSRESAVRCIDPYVLAQVCVCVCVSPVEDIISAQRYSSDVPQASLVNVPSDTPLISVLVCFCRKPPQPGNSLTFLARLSPHQAKWVLINSSWLPPSPCLLHWFISLFLFFSCSSRFQIPAPVLCTHLRRSLSINPGRSLSLLLLFHATALSILLFLSPLPSLTMSLILFFSCLL